MNSPKRYKPIISQTNLCMFTCSLCMGVYVCVCIFVGICEHYYTHTCSNVHLHAFTDEDMQNRVDSMQHIYGFSDWFSLQELSGLHPSRGFTLDHLSWSSWDGWLVPLAPVQSLSPSFFCLSLLCWDRGAMTAIVLVTFVFTWAWQKIKTWSSERLVWLHPFPPITR